MFHLMPWQDKNTQNLTERALSLGLCAFLLIVAALSLQMQLHRELLQTKCHFLGL